MCLSELVHNVSTLTMTYDYNYLLLVKVSQVSLENSLRELFIIIILLYILLKS